MLVPVPQTAPPGSRARNLAALVLVLVVMLFFIGQDDGTPDPTSSSSSSAAGADGGDGGAADAARERNADAFRAAIEARNASSSSSSSSSAAAAAAEPQHTTAPPQPFNITGYFGGRWAAAPAAGNRTAASATPNEREDVGVAIGVAIGVPASLLLSPSAAELLRPKTSPSAFTRDTGAFMLRITRAGRMSASRAIIEVRGRVYLLDSLDTEDWAAPTFSAPVRGVYLPHAGTLTAFTNPRNFELFLQNLTFSDRRPDPAVVVRRPPGSGAAGVLVHSPPPRAASVSGRLVAGPDGMLTLARNGTNASLVMTTEVPPPGDQAADDNSEGTGVGECVLRLDLDVSSARSSQPQHQQHAPMATFQGTVTAPLNCPLARPLRVSAAGKPLDFDLLMDKGRFYGLLESVVCALQLVAHARMLHETVSPAVRRSMSTTTMLILAGTDAALCLGHLFVGVVYDPLFSWFFIVCFLKFLLFSSLELRYVSWVWAARDPQTGGAGQAGSPQERRNVLSTHFFCALLLVAAALYHLFGLVRVVACCAMSFVAPQVATNAYLDSAPAVLAAQRRYLALSASRLFLPCFVWGLGANGVLDMFPLGPTPLAALQRDWLFLAVLLAWFGAQLALLHQQEMRGDARFFVPVRFLPVPFDYRRPIPGRLAAAAGGAPGATEAGPGAKRRRRWRRRQRNAKKTKERHRMRTADEEDTVGLLERGGRGSKRDRSGGSDDVGSSGQEEDTGGEWGIGLEEDAAIARVDGNAGGDGAEGGDVCAVCMSPVDTLTRPPRYMLTPCNHLFHDECLTQWFESGGLSCPVCRASCPPE